MTSSRVFFWSGVAGAATLLSVSGAEAQTVPPRQAPAADRPAERRSGLVLGVLGGGALGSTSGNPEALARRDDPAYRRNTGWSGGYRWTPFIGVALTDWFSFGMGITSGALESGAYRSELTAFVFHLEAFPLYGKGGGARDWGISADLGAGASKILRKPEKDEVAASGVASTIGIGTFWEPIRWWHTAGGPFVAYQRNWSDHYRRDDVVLGLRWVYYGGP